jgi:alpha-L-fucosidase
MREMELTTLSCRETSHSLRPYGLVRKEYKSSSALPDSLAVKGYF